MVKIPRMNVKLSRIAFVKYFIKYISLRLLVGLAKEGFTLSFLYQAKAIINEKIDDVIDCIKKTEGEGKR